MPSWSEVSVLRATEDWADGYKFEMAEVDGGNDYGHIFPIEKVTEFNRAAEVVNASITSSLKNYSRFWNMNRCSEDIEYLLAQDKNLYKKTTRANERFRMDSLDAFHEFFQTDMFANRLYQKLTTDLNGKDWETALVEGLKALYPEPYFIVTQTGGKSEKKHGSDITIQIPGIGGKHYLIAIQVKDYKGIITDQAEKQINKASYFEEQDSDCIVIDKIIIVTHASKEQHEELISKADGVRYLFEEDTKELCAQLAFAFISMKPLKNI